MTVLALAALWMLLSVVVCLIVAALCRAGSEEDDHWAARERGPARGDGSEPAV